MNTDYQNLSNLSREKYSTDDIQKEAGDYFALLKAKEELGLRLDRQGQTIQRLIKEISRAGRSK